MAIDRLRQTMRPRAGSAAGAAPISRRLVLAGSLASVLPFRRVEAAPVPAIRIGALRYGTAMWELEVIRRRGLDREAGIDVQVVELAGSEAGRVALQAGSVDMIVADWVWAMRQRAEGALLTSIPFSRAVGALELPSGSSVGELPGLIGRKLGVAGGPLDKSWILLRALTRRELDWDIAEEAEPVFGAPPLLEREFKAGRLDALLTFWNFAARLEAAGARPLLTVADMLTRLGISAEVPLLAYVFGEEWASGNRQAIARFGAVSARAKALLRSSDEDWGAITPLLGTEDERVRAALRTAYAAGIPGPWSEPQREAAARLFAVLRDTGGEPLVGAATAFDQGVFRT